MEPKELSPALLQPQVTVVATLGELLATLPTWQEETLLESRKRLHRDLEEFTKELRATLHRTKDTWRHRSVTFDDADPVTSLSQALAAYKITPRTTWDDVAMVASKWQRAVAVLVNSWAWLAGKATELRDTCRDLATKAADMAATARARELQAEAAHDGTAQEQRVELGHTLGGEEGTEVVAGREAQVRAEAMVAASGARRATMERQQLEAALGLLERLVAACDEATAFPRELQRRVRDIKAALKGRKKKVPDVPEDLVAKAAVAERLWEASARLARGHLLGAVDDFIVEFHSKAGPSASGVAERCQRAIEDIPRLLQSPERPQGVPEESPLPPALLQSQVTVVATLGELQAILGKLLATLPTWQEGTLLESRKRLHRDLEEFTKELRATLRRTEDTWRHLSVTSLSHDDDPVTSLSRALAAYKSTPWSTWYNVTMAASNWQQSVSVLLESWAQLAGKATKVRDTCRDLATKVADVEATATARARELQAEAARDGTAQEHSVELGQALGGEEGAEVVAGREAQVRREAWVASSEAIRATMERWRLEAALGPLQRLVAACDEATAFPRELQRRVRDIEAALEETTEASPDVLKHLVAKAAEAERLWEANARLAKDHLLGAVDDIIIGFHSKAGPSASGVAERCQRAIEDIPRLLQSPERPQGVPEVSPLSPALLQSQVTMVATLGKLLATLPTWQEGTLLESRKRLHRDLEKFTKELRATLRRTEDTWRHRSVTFDDADPVTSLSQALAAYKITPQATRDDVAMVASKWQPSVAVLADSWTRLAGKATELRDTCREVATKAADRAATARARELQAKAAHYGTAQEHSVELGQTLGGEEGTEVVAGQEAQVREEPMVAASGARRATMERQQLEAALGQLQHLVATCDEATEFPRELQRLLGDIKATPKGTTEVSPDVPEDLVAKAAEAERLWEASARLAKDHLVGAVDDIIIGFHSEGGGARPGACEVAERCQRATEDIPKLLQE